MYGDGGSGFVSPTANRQFGSNDAYDNSALPVLLDGFELHAYSKASTNAHYFEGQAGASMEGYVRGTAASVVYYVGPAAAGYGTFNVSIDGEWLANIDTAWQSDEQQQRTTSFAVPAGQHRLLLRVMSGTAVIVGAAGRNGAGVVVDNMSVPGLGLVRLSNALSSGNPFVNADGGSPATADLLVVMLGLNDASWRHSPADFVAAMRAAIGTYQRAGVADILVAAANGGSAQYDNENYRAFRAALPALAAELHVALVDLNNIATPSYGELAAAGFWSRVPTRARIECASPPGLPSSGLDDANAVHPSDVGHWNIAHALWPFVSETLSNSSAIPITWTPRRVVSSGTASGTGGVG